MTEPATLPKVTSPEYDRETVAMSAGQQNRGRDAQSASGAQEDGAPAWDNVKDTLEDVAEAAAERGRGFVDSARVQAAGYVDERKNAVATALTDLANSLRESGGAFGDRPGVGTLFATAADGIEGIAHRIQDQDLGDVYAEAEDFFRRRPGTAAVASFAAGFLLSRFVKASAQAGGQHHGTAGASSTNLPARTPVQARA